MLHKMVWYVTQKHQQLAVTLEQKKNKKKTHFAYATLLLVLAMVMAVLSGPAVFRTPLWSALFYNRWSFFFPFSGMHLIVCDILHSMFRTFFRALSMSLILLLKALLIYKQIKWYSLWWKVLRLLVHFKKMFFYSWDFLVCACVFWRQSVQ